jgi:hypothetical protein
MDTTSFPPGQTDPSDQVSTTPGAFHVAAVDRLAPALLAELPKRAGLALLAPVRQVRRVQALPAQQITDLTRPGARVRLGQDLGLVPRRELPALGLLNQLRVRHPLGHGAPAGPESQPGYAALIFAAGNTRLRRSSSSIRARLQHVRRSPFSPSRSLIPRW